MAKTMGSILATKPLEVLAMILRSRNQRQMVEKMC